MATSYCTTKKISIRVLFVLTSHKSWKLAINSVKTLKCRCGSPAAQFTAARERHIERVTLQLLYIEYIYRVHVWEGNLISELSPWKSFLRICAGAVDSKPHIQRTFFNRKQHLARVDGEWESEKGGGVGGISIASSSQAHFREFVYGNPGNSNSADVRAISGVISRSPQCCVDARLKKPPEVLSIIYITKTARGIKKLLFPYCGDILFIYFKSYIFAWNQYFLLFTIYDLRYFMGYRKRLSFCLPRRASLARIYNQTFAFLFSRHQRCI